MIRRRASRADVVTVARADLEELQDELARLHLERHRPINLSEVGRAARDVADAANDEAVHVLAEAEALRSSLIGVLRDLQTAGAQLQRQLETDMPSAEIDRRVISSDVVIPKQDQQRLSVVPGTPFAIDGDFRVIRTEPDNDDNNDLNDDDLVVRF
jgi:hypothetical protein